MGSGPDPKLVRASRISFFYFETCNDEKCNSQNCGIGDWLQKKLITTIRIDLDGSIPTVVNAVVNVARKEKKTSG